MRSGPACLIEGFRLLARPGLRRFVVLPALGNLVLFLLASAALFFALDLALDRWLPDGADWLRWVLFPLLALALFAGGLFLFVVLANLLLGPFLGVLASQVIRQIGGDVPSEAGDGFFADLRRDLGQEMRRWMYVAVCMLGIFILSLIPVVQLAAAPLGVVVGAWLLSMEYSAHSLSLFRLSLSEQLAFLRGQRLATLSFGLASMGALLIPVVNLLVVPASVAGMAVFVHERRKQSGAAGGA